MRIKHLLAIALTVLFLAVVLVPPSGAQAPKAPAGPKIIRFAYSMPSKKSHSYGWEWLGPEFEKRTNGRYKVEYYPGETLFKMAAAYDSVIANVAQIANISVGQLERRIPLSNGALLPTLDFPMTLKARMAAGRAFMDMYQKLPQLQAEWPGVRLFAFEMLSPYVLASKKKEVYLPEHFKGYKLGGTGLRMKLVTNAGGADVNQVPPDAYMNMDKGVVDGCLVGWSQVWDYKLWEVAKYFYEGSFGAGAFGMVMHPDLWNGMSLQDQQAFTELWNKAYEIALEYDFAELEKGAKAAAAGGAKIRKPAPQEVVAWRKAAEPVIQQWIVDAKKAGAKDPEAVLAEWQRQLQAYKE